MSLAIWYLCIRKLYSQLRELGGVIGMPLRSWWTMFEKGDLEPTLQRSSSKFNHYMRAKIPVFNRIVGFLHLVHLSGIVRCFLPHREIDCIWSLWYNSPSVGNDRVLRDSLCPSWYSVCLTSNGKCIAPCSTTWLDRLYLQPFLTISAPAPWIFQINYVWKRLTDFDLTITLSFAILRP